VLVDIIIMTHKNISLFLNYQYKTKSNILIAKHIDNLKTRKYFCGS